MSSSVVVIIVISHPLYLHHTFQKPATRENPLPTLSEFTSDFRLLCLDFTNLKMIKNNNNQVAAYSIASLDIKFKKLLNPRALKTYFLVLTITCLYIQCTY